MRQSDGVSNCTNVARAYSANCGTGESLLFLALSQAKTSPQSWKIPKPVADRGEQGAGIRLWAAERLGRGRYDEPGSEPCPEKKGIGRRLVLATDRAVKEPGGLRTLTLEVRAGNSAAIHVYELLGYRSWQKAPLLYRRLRTPCC